MEVNHEQSVNGHLKEPFQSSRFLQQQQQHAPVHQPHFPRLARGYCTHCGVLLQFKLQNINEPAVKVQCPKCTTISAFSVTPLHMNQANTAQNGGHVPQPNQMQYQQFQQKQVVPPNSMEQIPLDTHYQNPMQFQTFQNGNSHGQTQTNQYPVQQQQLPVQYQTQTTQQHLGQQNVVPQQSNQITPQVVLPLVVQAQPQTVLPQLVQTQIAQPQIAQPQIAQPQIAQPQIAQPQISQPQIQQPGSPQQTTVSSLVSMHKVDELKEKCRKMGLRVGGTKTELATRIVHKLSQQGSPASPSQPSTTSPQQQQHSTTSPSSSPSTPNIPSPTIPTNLQPQSVAPIPQAVSLKRSPPSDNIPAPINNHKKVKSEPRQETWLSLLETYDPLDSYVPRTFHSAVVYNGCMYVFGGQPTSGRMEDSSVNVGVFDFASGTWSCLNCTGTPPPQRKEHSAVIFNDHMYVFGGEGKTRVLNDFYSLNLKEGEQHEWRLITTEEGPIPPPRAAHSAVVIGNSMLVFGGYDVQSGQWEGEQCHCENEGDWDCVCQLSMYQVFDDLWEFSFEDKTWKKETRRGEWPCPRNSHIAVARENAMYIVGGHKRASLNLIEGPFEDLWSWSVGNHTWEHTPTKGQFPKTMLRGNGVLDSASQCLFVFNNENNYKGIHRLNLNNQSWEKFGKLPEWDYRSEFGRFHFYGMSVVLKDDKVFMLGDFADLGEPLLGQPEKHLVVFQLDKF